MSEMNLDPSIKELFALYDSNEAQILKDFFDLLRIKSISAEPEFKADVLKAADFVSTYLSDGGFEVERWETSGFPVLFASWLGAGADAPTVLFYGHYDVQPVDPLELWTTPPFEPTIRDGEVYARGAQDNKGQNFYTIAALTYLLRANKKLPVNVKLIIEGEEEIGSPGLSTIVDQKQKELKSDYALVVDVGIHAIDAPSVTVGMRGIITMTVELTGSNTDLHSGSHGGIAYNPNHALVHLLAKLRDEKSGRVLVPGFYDSVTEIDSEFRKAIDFSYDIDGYEQAFSAKACGGETEYTAVESAWLRPTLEINGLGGGYSGPGFKTVIPAKALAKISCRLVPNQDPKEIAEAVRDFLVANCPEAMHIDVDIMPGYGPGLWTNPNSPLVNACADAFSDVYNKPCRKILEGATIPISVALAKSAQADIALIGYGLPGDKIHAPNEHFGLNRLRMGFATIGRIVQLLAK